MYIDNGEDNNDVQETTTQGLGGLAMGRGDGPGDYSDGSGDNSGATSIADASGAAFDSFTAIPAIPAQGSPTGGSFAIDQHTGQLLINWARRGQDRIAAKLAAAAELQTPAPLSTTATATALSDAMCATATDSTGLLTQLTAFRQRLVDFENSVRGAMSQYDATEQRNVDDLLRLTNDF
jgi:hypothetical protein